MSDKAERERHCAELRAAMTSLAGHQLARASSGEDFIASAVTERALLDDEQEAGMWARSGEALRAVDPESYKLLAGLAASLAAVAAAPAEN